MGHKISEALFDQELKLGIVYPGAKYRVSVPKSCKCDLMSGIVALGHQSDGSEIYRPFRYGDSVMIISEEERQALPGRMPNSKSGLVLQVKSLSIKVGSCAEEVAAQLVNAPDDGLEKWIKAEIRKMMDSPSEADAKSNCPQAYRNCLLAVEAKIWATIRKFRTDRITEKVKVLFVKDSERLEAAMKEEEVVKDSERLEAALKEEVDYLRKLKYDLSQRGDRQDFPVVSITRCSSSASWYNAITWKSSESCIDLCVKYILEEKDGAATTWRGFELSPKKDDLEKLVNDPKYVLCPVFTDGKHLLDIHPRTQKLLLVFTMEEGQVLVFVEDRKADALLMYLGEKLGTGLGNPIRSTKRGYDLLCFDEKTRLIAFYDKSREIIKVFRFGDSFRHMDWTGAVVNLSEFSVQRLIWMGFLSGKAEITFIDDQHRVRVAEVNQPAIVRPGNLHLGPDPILKAIVSLEGSCLMIVRSGPKSCNTDIAPEDVENADGSTKKEDKEREQSLSIGVLKIQESVVSTAMVVFDIVSGKLRDPSSLDVAMIGFGTKLHLLLL